MLFNKLVKVPIYIFTEGSCLILYLPKPPFLTCRGQYILQRAEQLRQSRLTGKLLWGTEAWKEPRTASPATAKTAN